MLMKKLFLSVLAAILTGGFPVAAATYTADFNAGNLLNVQFNDSNCPNQTGLASSIKSTPIARPETYTGAIGNTVFNSRYVSS